MKRLRRIIFNSLSIRSLLLCVATFVLVGCNDSSRIRIADAQVNTTVKSVVFALDKTAMTAEEFNLLRNSVVKAVMELKPSEQFSVIAYDEEVHTVWEGTRLANAENQEIARDWLMTLKKGSRGSESFLAMKEVAKSKETHIYFICNPACFSGYAKLRSVAEELKATTSVHIIAFNDHDALVEYELRELAKITGGDFRFLDLSPSVEVKVFGSERRL